MIQSDAVRSLKPWEQSEEFKDCAHFGRGEGAEPETCQHCSGQAPAAKASECGICKDWVCADCIDQPISKLDQPNLLTRTEFTGNPYLVCKQFPQTICKRCSATNDMRKRLSRNKKVAERLFRVKPLFPE